MRNKLLVIFGLLLSFAALAKSPISMIYVDAETENKIGDWPIKRTYYADAINILNEKYKPRFIVLKIFLDAEKPEDKVLAEALKKNPNVFTQALASEEDQPWKGPIPLQQVWSKNPGYENFNSGWFPNATIAPYFKGVGLVNGRSNDKDEVNGFYLVNSIQNKLYASLPVILAAAWKKSRVNVDLKKLDKGAVAMPEFPKTNPWPVYSFKDLLDKSIPENALKDGMVFIFYNGKKASPLKYPGGKFHIQAETVAIMTDYLIEH